MFSNFEEYQWILNITAPYNSYIALDCSRLEDIN